MSYTEYLRATSNAAKTASPVSPPISVHRKPVSSLRSESPITQSRSETPFTHGSITSIPFLANPQPPPVSITPDRSLRNSSEPASESRVQEVKVLKSLSQKETDDALEICLNIQKRAVSEQNKRPFGAALLGPDNTTVLATHFSISHVQHAESELIRLAAIQYSQTYLAQCTLVSTWEPCAMCSGTLYWSNIGRLLYAASEDKLRELTGAHNTENMTMNLPCRTVLAAGQRDIEIIGPVPGWEEKVIQESIGWWKDHQGKAESPKRAPTIDTASISLRSISTSNHAESFLSNINEDGEYQADLGKIDWMM